jgi:hypothetical protein
MHLTDYVCPRNFLNYPYFSLYDFTVVTIFFGDRKLYSYVGRPTG